jgi:hypothetical protein
MKRIIQTPTYPVSVPSIQCESRQASQGRRVEVVEVICGLGNGMDGMSAFMLECLLSKSVFFSTFVSAVQGG